MEVVTKDELSAYIAQLQESIEGLGDRLAASQGAPRREYMNRGEASDYLRMSTRTLDSLTATGKIKRAKLGAGPKAPVLYRRSDLDGFFESCLEMDLDDAKTAVNKRG